MHALPIRPPDTNMRLTVSTPIGPFISVTDRYAEALGSGGLYFLEGPPAAWEEERGQELARLEPELVRAADLVASFLAESHEKLAFGVLRIKAGVHNDDFDERLWARLKDRLQVLELKLKATAEAGKAEPAAVAAPAPQPADAGLKTKGKNIDARMLKTLADEPESTGWSSEDWADRLKCTSGTVRQTNTWKKHLPALRAREALTRGELKRLDRKQA